MDEHRLGLLPVIKRVWAPRGTRPTAPVRRRYQWLYVYGFVRPQTGATWWCLLPTVSIAAYQLALAAFARDEGIAATRRVALVVDRAGWHTSRRLELPVGVDLVFLPAASPELAPAERLWSLVDAPLVNRVVADLDDLETTLVTRCNHLQEHQQDRIRTLTHYHWWPQERPARTTQ